MPTQHSLPLDKVAEWVRVQGVGKLQEELAMTRIPLSRAEEFARTKNERLQMSIAEMKLSVRTTNCLEETGIFTVRDLLHATPKKLLSISNFGEKTLEEVYAALEELGFYRPGRQPQE